MSAPQIVCPVCHTRQPNAWDCAVCGGSLHDKPRHWQVPVQPLEGLETTALSDPGQPAVELLEGLEITSFAGEGPIETAGPLEGLETTGWGEFGDGPVEALPDLEATSFVVDALPTPLLPTVCRYCGTPWREGSIFCGGCGVRVATRGSDGDHAGSATVTCKACGVLGQVPGRMCLGCGQQVTG